MGLLHLLTRPTVGLPGTVPSARGSGLVSSKSQHHCSPEVGCPRDAARPGCSAWEHSVSQSYFSCDWRRLQGLDLCFPLSTPRLAICPGSCHAARTAGLTCQGGLVPVPGAWSHFWKMVTSQPQTLRCLENSSSHLGFGICPFNNILEAPGLVSSPF